MDVWLFYVWLPLAALGAVALVLIRVVRFLVFRTSMAPQGLPWLRDLAIVLIISSVPALFDVNRPWGKGQLMPYMESWVEEIEERQGPIPDKRLLFDDALKYAREREASVKLITNVIYLCLILILGGVIAISVRNERKCRASTDENIVST